MKATMKHAAILAAGLVLISGAAFAEMVEGQVTAVNAQNNSLTIQRLKNTGGQESINLTVPPDKAEFRGVASLNEIGVGDQVRAEANKTAMGMGAWEAKWIEKSTAGAGSAQGMGSAAGMGSTSTRNSASNTGQTSTARQAGSSEGQPGGTQSNPGSY